MLYTLIVVLVLIGIAAIALGLIAMTGTTAMIWHRRGRWPRAS
jgi:hypothetical protein